MKKTEAAPRLSPAKRRFFSLVVLVLPFALLVLVELSLRLLHYREDLDLIRTTRIRNQEYYQLNRFAAARYFAEGNMVTPEFHEERFKKTKGSHTKRVFCLGESTMEGFPYEFNATAPSFLKDRLSSMLPGDSLEVINAGVSAVGSYVVADVMRQLLDYDPDLFVVYLGHNEFYGAYGAGSAIGSGSVPWLTRLGIRLLHLKIYLALRDTYTWVTGRLGTSNMQHNATLMQQMVGDTRIPLQSTMYRSTLATYRENLLRLIEVARSLGVPILFSSLVSNERHQPPFVGLFSDTSSVRTREAWAALLKEADSLRLTGEVARSVDLCRKTVALDERNADGFFRLAMALEADGRFPEARAAYLKAKDLDALRFRATEEFQQALLDVCRQQKVPCARVDSAFVAASPHGIVGHELVLEHVHPNIRGYMLMASVWAKAIQENRLLEPHGQWQNPPPDSVLFSQSMVSAFDEVLGTIKTTLLTRKWPFQSSAENLPYRPQDSVAAIVFGYVRQKLTWSDARYELAAYYARRGQFDLARKECLAVSRIIPFSYQPMLRVADYYRQEGMNQDAAVAYRRCIAIEENPYAHMKLGLLLIEAGNDSTGATELERGLALDGLGGMSMPANAKATGRYLLGIAYARTGRIADARNHLAAALTLDPGLKPARDLLNQLQKH